jgi:hypothetical protein
MSPINVHIVSNLVWCSSLPTLHEGIEQLTQLQTLRLLSCAALHELPQGISRLVHLTELNLPWCSAMKSLPDGIGQLTKLQPLAFNECLVLHELPQSMPVDQSSISKPIEVRAAGEVHRSTAHATSLICRPT